jgi:tetratricopeptide (TPR) repeat protein
VQKLFSIALLVFLLSVCASSQNSGTSIEAALGSRQYDQALQLIRAALHQSPKDAKLLTYEGYALSRTGRRLEALRAYDAALAVSPKSLAALEGAAQLEYESKSKRAIPLLNRILAQQPDNTTSHAMLAVLSYQAHDCPTAVKHFQASEAIIAGQPMALGAYGACLMGLEHAGDAVPIFQQLASLRPDDPHVRYNLAVVQLAADQAARSVETLQPLLEAGSQDPDVLDLASAAYEKTGDTPRAVSLLRRAILASPQTERYYVDFGTLSFNHSSFQVGIDVINAGLVQLPKSARLFTARGILYVQLGQYEKGQADFEMANKLDPLQASASVAQGLAQMQASQLGQALKTVESQIAAHPDDAFLRYLKAEILSRNGATAGTGDFKTAIESASRAVQLKPDFTLARDVLGNLYLKSGQIEKSVEESRATLRYDPADDIALYHLIQGLRRTKDPNGEIPDLTKRLAAARESSKQKEAAEGRYKLYEPDARAAPVN